jgi:hypothetical protein
MILRNIRGLTATMVAMTALLSAAGRSSAEIQVMIQEVDSTGKINIGSAQTFTLSGSGTSTPAASTADFTNISVTVTTTSGGTPSDVNSITSTVGLKPVAGFNPSNQLMVTVIDDGFLNSNAGGIAAITNNAGASSGIVGGTNSFSNQTELYSGLIGSLTNLGGTNTASAVSPGGSSSDQTTGSIASIPAQFAIDQTIFVAAVPNSLGSIDSNSTLGGSASSTVVTSAAAVPGPGGLALALIGLPLIGLRRALRKAPAV